VKRFNDKERKARDREITIEALRYSLTLTAATALVIGMNVFAGVNGYDVRSIEWWLVSPALTFCICYVAVRLSIK
jgi:hypothetical protein